MIKKSILLLSILAFTFSQAQFLTRLITGKTGVDDIRILEKGEKTVIYIPTIHVEKPQYYEAIKKYVDSVRGEGYVIFYEGIGIEKGTSDEDRTILNLKLRKLLGFNVSKPSDEKNKSTPKYYKRKKYINQSEADLGIRPEIDVRADLTTNEIVRMYEEKYGILKLTDCDYNTPLNEKYKCKDDKEFLNKGSAQYVVTNEFRDDFLIDLLLNSKENKILLLYGEAHWIHAIFPRLVYKNDFKLIQGKI